MSVRRRSIQARMRVELEQERGRHSFTKGILETYQKLSKQAVEENTKLREGLKRLRAGIIEHATDTVWSGACETVVDAITNLLGDIGP